MESGQALPQVPGLNDARLDIARPVGRRRPFLDQLAKLLDRLLRPLGADLDPAVGHIAGEADQTKLKGPSTGPPAEPDTLNPPPDKDRDALHGQSLRAAPAGT